MINMKTEEIDEFVKSYAKEVEKLHNCADRFAQSNKKLEGWNSPAKRKLEGRMNASIPAFDELIDVVLSYATVANNANREIMAAESEILKSLG